ncbi:zinc-ribbon domain-containing protein [Clostridioides difficile]|nr:zinc-ribbon domain-containing protein [Clostridioides difficile]
MIKLIDNAKEIRNVRLKKHMKKQEVNKLIGRYLKLMEDIYLGNDYYHNWKCQCGNILNKKKWNHIRYYSYIGCEKCKYKKIKERHKREIERNGKYEYINSYFKGDTLPNGDIVKNTQTKVLIKHKFCGSIYIIRYSNFINEGHECIHCCGSYENSFAYYIEKELGEPIEKYWDFEKNKVSPYNIWKNRNSKNSEGEDTRVWIKCIKKDYHESYLISCTDFVKGNRCQYCASKKIHPKDSFAQYCIDNIDKDFLNKYWSNENVLNPYNLSIGTQKNIWIKCQEKEYHGDYKISCSSFVRGIRCKYCKGMPGNVHLYDSFGYNYFSLSQSWSNKNKISPFKIRSKSNRKVKFICSECGVEFEKRLCDITKRESVNCSECSSSRGENKIKIWLLENKIEYLHDISFNENLKGVNGGLLRPDFQLVDKSIWIEFNGEQHDRYISGFHKTKKDFLDQQENYKRKIDYANKNNIKVIEIAQKDFKNIEQILEKELR